VEEKLLPRIEFLKWSLGLHPRAAHSMARVEPCWAVVLPVDDVTSPLEAGEVRVLDNEGKLTIRLPLFG
jgi:hypothetical protein